MITVDVVLIIKVIVNTYHRYKRLIVTITFMFAKFIMFLSNFPFLLIKKRLNCSIFTKENYIKQLGFLYLCVHINVSYKLYNKTIELRCLKEIAHITLT